MVDLSTMLIGDPTLEAVDAAIEKIANSERHRGYLGFSEIGESCSRKIWYNFRHAMRPYRKAFLVKCSERGNKAETLQAERLRMVDGIELVTEDANGKQIEFSDCDGHFRGHCDGTIIGLLQAPKTEHIWEHKEREEKFVTKLKKIKSEIGEKMALREWSPVYYAQGCLYMFYKGLKRHYMTVTVPGGRETESIRTDEDTAHAMQMRAKAERIIKSHEPLERIGGPDYFECKMCGFFPICHESAMPDRGCRTCIHSTPIENGMWNCERFGKNLTLDEQIAGCPAHLFLPKLVPGDLIEADQEKGCISYKMKDGSMWIDSEGGIL